MTTSGQKRTFSKATKKGIFGVFLHLLLSCLAVIKKRERRNAFPVEL